MKPVDLILLVAITATLYTVCGFVVFDWNASLRGIAVSAFLVFGLWAMAFEIGFKTYWRSMRRLTFALVFATPTTVASVVFLWRLVRY
jgi:hypothetical protein